MRQREAVEVEALGEVAQLEGEAVFAFGLADVGGEDDRHAVGGEAELGRGPGRRGRG